MPLIFQKQTHRGLKHNNLPTFSNILTSSGSIVHNNTGIDAYEGGTAKNGGSVAGRGRRVFRTAIESFSSERAGGWFRRRGRAIARLARNPRQLLPLFKRYYRKWHLKHLLPLFFVLLYMLIGAFIFLWLEAADERKRIEKKLLFMKRVDEILQDRDAAVQYSVRRRYVEEALDHFHTQLAVRGATKLNAQLDGDWSSIVTAMYYAGTIFTTIGYGDIACATVAGRIVTVVYAIIGIPMMLITLSHLGKFLYKWINEIVAACTLFADQICAKLWPKRYAKKRENERLANGFFRANKSAPALLHDAAAMTRAGGDDMAVTRNGTKKQSIMSAPARAQSHDEHRVNFVLHTGDENEDEEEMTLEMDAHNDTATSASKISSASPPPKILVVQPRDQAQKLAAELELGEHTASIDLESGWKIVQNDEVDDNDEALLPDESPLPRMPVLVALTCTVSWIFLCAALFKLWETNWTYAESCYFMFISLSTIGLGDVNVKRRDLMVVCFIFVIIGLSLVSMCINVIQSALEDLYRRLLMKILLDYQAKMAEGGDAHSASMGMMKMWGSSKTARYLMPMLSADTRRAVLQKVQEDAKETGLEIPPIFEDMDEKTGMPKILAVAANADSLIEHQSAIVSELVNRQIEAATAAAVEQPPPLRKSASQEIFATSTIPLLARPICHDNDTQTDRIYSDEKTAQTTIIEWEESFVQTDEQTELAPIPECADASTMTLVASFIDMDIQTEKVFIDDAQIQTHLFDVEELAAQTDAPPIVEAADKLEQTEDTQTADAEVQTDEIVDPRKAKNISKIREARRRLQSAFEAQKVSARRVSYGGRPTTSNWRDSMRIKGAIAAGSSDSNERLGEVDDEEERSSYESLNWDPIDGLHAEKQRPVSDLKRMFDRGSGTHFSGPTSSQQELNRTFSVMAVSSKKKYSQQHAKK